MSGAISRHASRGEEVGIVLVWLVRLRWLAAVGQVVAVTAAGVILQAGYPWVPLAVIIGLTVGTNVLLALLLARGGGMLRRPWVVPGVIVLDILLLTALLALTGGADNPFALLYVLHVALAASVLGSGRTWGIVGVVAACYALISTTAMPLTPDDAAVSPAALAAGRTAAVLLVVVLIAYFVSRVVGALATREAELAAARERAQVSERLAALTTLAAGAAHELGTPLATIAVVAKEMEYSARLIDTAELADDLADDALLVRTQVDRCRDILERLRGDVAGRTTDEPGSVNPIDVAEATRRELQPERRRRLDLRIAGALPASVAASGRAVRQALGLLVNNAFDACDVEAALPAERRRVSMRVTADDGGVTFRVADRGPGMTSDTLRRAVEPFYTTKDPGRGMGLGLFLVRLVAERNGGTFTLDSAPDAGTTATLWLPSA